MLFVWQSDNEYYVYKQGSKHFIIKCSYDPMIAHLPIQQFLFNTFANQLSLKHICALISATVFFLFPAAQWYNITYWKNIVIFLVCPDSQVKIFRTPISLEKMGNFELITLYSKSRCNIEIPPIINFFVVEISTAYRIKSVSVQ